DPRSRHLVIAKPGRPGVSGTADAHAEADVLHSADRRAKCARLLERPPLKADENSIVVEQPQRVRNDVATRPLQLDHQPDPPTTKIDRLGERRVNGAWHRPVVGHAQIGPDVELDVVGSELDRPLERRQGVFRALERRAAVRYDKHCSSSRSIVATSIRSTTSSASAIRAAPSVRVKPTT